MTRDTPAGWASAWPDALAFAAGLAVAWLGQWTTADLVWSLWLSSLVVGYSMIVWRIFRPALVIGRGAWRDRALVREAVSAHGPLKPMAAGSAALVGGIFMLAFFTVHFGMFHYVHSQFLAGFFPIPDAGSGTWAGTEVYVEVARRYFWFLPAAFLAERAAFAMPVDSEPPDRSVTAAAIATRKSARRNRLGSGLMAPYRNVLRMHLLIFFFASASFAALENFTVYAVVYAVYFFPWRLVRSSRRDAVPAGVPSGS